MANKNDILTEREFKNFQLDQTLERCIFHFINKSHLDPEDINILDYGCGRGRSVLKLIDKGFNVYGVDSDKSVLQNGYRLFIQHGYNPEKILFHADSLKNFPEQFFHITFSEQVIEHLKNLKDTFLILNIVTKKEGLGIHLFPGWMKIMESHVHMPFIHWFSNRYVRYLLILLFCLAGKGPKPPWPELTGRTILAKIKRYNIYLEDKTNYIDIRKVCHIINTCGFKVDYTLKGNNKNRFIPDILKRNGFPNSNIILHTQKI